MEKVAIIIPTYNSMGFLEKTIESCKNQSYRNVDIIIVDDCSEDNTRLYLRTLDGVKIYLNEENKGLAKNLNFAVGKSDADYFIFLGHDDILPYSHVETMVQEIKTDKGIGLVHCNAIKIDSAGAVLEFSRDNKVQSKKSERAMYFLAIDNFIQSCGMLVDRRKFLEIGGWDESFKLYGEWLCHVKLASKWKIRFCDKTHGYYRVHSGSTMRMINQKQENEIKLYKQMCRTLATSLLDKAEKDISLRVKQGYRFAKENFNYK